MRIVHIADVHWRGLSRHEEYIIAFKRFFKKAKELKPDVIYLGGDIVHSKTQGISPELIQSLCWWFTNLAKVCPVHVILGNHDGLILNRDRQDAITPIINALDNPDIHLYKYSGVYSTGHEGFNWCVFSCFDEDEWCKVKPSDDSVDIALYHGAVRGSLTDTDWQIDGEINIDVFESYDFALLGDIHKRQFLNEEKTVAYCGSTIQQNYGECQEKGFLLWDIKSKDDFDVEFHSIDPVYPFITVDWRGTAQETLEYCESMPRQSRFRIRAKNFISQIDSKWLQKQLKKSCNAKEVVFKIDSSFESENFITDDTDERLDLRSGEVHKTLLRNYYGGQIIEDEHWQHLDTMVEKYLSEITNDANDRRHVKWSINKIMFDNMFSYGEDNLINFDSMPGITGIFGRNARGKSSIVGSIAYGLFNTTDRGSISNIHVINSRRNNCKVSLDITINGQPYRIIRETVKKQTKKNTWAPTTLSLFKLDNSGNIVEDLTEEQRRETEKIIRNMLGTSEEFLMTSLASQGEMNTFIKEKASARKNILANFLDLGVFDKLYDASRKDSQALRHRASSLSSENWMNKITECQTKIDDYVMKKASVENKIETDKIMLSTLQKELHSSGDLDYITSTDVEREKEQINATTMQISNHEKKRFDLLASIEGSEAKVKKVNDFVEGFNLEEVKKKRDAKSKIEKELLELQGIYRLEKRDLDQIKKSVSKLSEVPCGDSFPTCKFIKDSHESKKRAENQERKVTLLSVKVDDITEAFSELSEDYDSQLEKYSKIIQVKSSLIDSMSSEKVEIERAEQKISQLSTQVASMQDRLRLLEEKILLQKDNDKISKVKIRIHELEASLKMHDKERTRVINNLATWRANIRINKNHYNDYKDVNSKLKIHDMFTQAVSKRGIPVQLINTLLPKINAEASKILQGVVNFNVELEADLDSNAMDMYINYGDSKRIIELGSGMEKMLASLAIRVALINMSSLPKTNMLIIDEGFGALDETNLEACSKLLESLKKYFKNILVISHIDAIKDVADNTVEIVKKGVDSYVYQP
jgi:DNA repair exonuclease SbcCD ATPase subunit